ncbi:MAG: hypothetical protein AB8G18_19455 [Gammaproteobacteria bacterium]
MLSVVRMYPSEDQAREAIRLLEKEDLAGSSMHLFAPVAGSEAQTIKNAIADGQLPGSHIHVCRRALEKGHYVLTVEPHFYRGEETEMIMNSCGAVDTDLLPEYHVYNPAPLSDFFGLPVLAKHNHSLNAKQLTSSSWSFSSMFGLGMLSDKATPLSSIFGLKTLTQAKSKNSSFGLPLLSKKPTPLSSTIGMKPLTSAKSKNSSFGIPLLSHNPAPLSSLFNIRLLSKSTKD